MVSLIPQVKTRVLTQKFKISKQKVDGNELGAVSGKEKTVAGTKELFESLVVIKVASFFQAYFNCLEAPVQNSILLSS